MIAYMYYLVHSGGIIVSSIMQLAMLCRVVLFLLVFLVFWHHLAFLLCTGTVISLHGSVYGVFGE